MGAEKLGGAAGGMNMFYIKTVKCYKCQQGGYMYEGYQNWMYQAG